MSVEAIRWHGTHLELLDQRLLPHERVYRRLTDVPAVADAIRTMVVRGAPAIGVTAAYGMALAGQQAIQDGADMDSALHEAYTLLLNTRPTAINLRWALTRMVHAAEASRALVPELRAARLEAEAGQLHTETYAVNRTLSVIGAPLLERCSGVLVHGNPGAMANAGFGTGLGMVRQAHQDGARFTVYVTETRPFLQGARMTVWELEADNIPTTLLIDSAAGLLMAKGLVQAVVVGAARVANNGDVVNKIGTYTMAVLAKAHGIPFYVAAPTSSFDPNMPDGRSTPIELRSPDEVTHMAGKRFAATPHQVYNPGFDATPAEFITGIVSEVGLITEPIGDQIAARWAEGQRWMRQLAEGKALL